MAPFKTFKAGTWGNVAYDVDIVSNSTLSSFHFMPTNASLLFNVTEPERAIDFCRITIPKSLLLANNDEWVIHANGLQITDYALAQDQEHTYIYFTCNGSSETITIQGTTAIPELASAFAILLLAMLASLAAMLCGKRRKLRLPKSA
jgi:hypothetical protein